MEARGGSGCRPPRAGRRRRAARAQRRLRCCPRALATCCACASRPPARAQAIRSSSPSRREPLPPPRWHSSIIPAARPRARAPARPCPRWWRRPVEVARGGWQRAPTRIGLVRSGCFSPVSPARAVTALMVAALAVPAVAAVARRAAAATWWLSSCPAVSWRESVCWPRCGRRAQPHY